jgi:hypothetical protein
LKLAAWRRRSSACIAGVYTYAMTITKAASRRARFKVLGAIAATHGYAILALAIVQPMLSAAPKFTSQQIGGLIVGLAMEAFAVYIAPFGELS